MPSSLHPIVIVGAGVAGLTLARELERRGHAPLVLERARGIGGRCATRRVDGQPVDHGVFFIHGESAALRRELASVDAAPCTGWPTIIDGDGTPCRPNAFDASSVRTAFEAGISQFPKHLAQRLQVRTNAQVTALDASASDGKAWALSTSDGKSIEAGTLILAVPPSNARDLLTTAATLPESVTGLLPLLALAPSVPCLTVIATYPAGTPAPSWHLAFPRESSIVHAISHDSSKRGAGAALTLVVQARAAWSRATLEQPVETWAAALLDEAARLHGPWLRQPASFQGHAWRKARVAPGCELSNPLLLDLPAGARLGFAGDAFHPAGGVEGAYLSGLGLARRLDEALALQRE